MRPTKFGVNRPFGSGEEEKNRFSRWRPWPPSWISDWNDFSYFWSTSHPDASYQVSSQLAFGVRRRSEIVGSWHLGLGEEAKNRFSRWPPCTISTILAIFDLHVTPMLPSKFGVNWPSVQEKKQKIDFQDGCHGSHLGFPIGTILAIFDLQVTQMLPTKFGVNWPFGSGEEAKNRFSRWRPWRPSWISDRHDFSYF